STAQHAREMDQKIDYVCLKQPLEGQEQTNVMNYTLHLCGQNKSQTSSWDIVLILSVMLDHFLDVVLRMGFGRRSIFLETEATNTQYVFCLSLSDSCLFVSCGTQDTSTCTTYDFLSSTAIPGVLTPSALSAICASGPLRLDSAQSKQLKTVHSFIETAAGESL
uniref:Uncharacterized protein n=1 Tax=Myripristis murdjan TaxID=586833 RepID=A0A667ZHY5_9TELE